MQTRLDTTESVCPVCLARLTAVITADEHGVFLEKQCPEHGDFRTIIWRGSRTGYESWMEDAGHPGESHPAGPHRAVDQGCPFDCGLCPGHASETCSAALMVTSRCNLACPVCFTRGKNEPLYEPSLARLKEDLRFYRDTSGGAFPLELCGGEPTVRSDLLEIVAMARALGFSHIQVNSNGLCLAEEPDLAPRLKDAGASVVYLGFDGADDGPYLATTGRKLFDVKKRAVENCAGTNLPVVLVPVIMPGVNTNHIGRIVTLAKSWSPAVKGVHFQPISYFGTYSHIPGNEDRLTIPDMLAALAGQTNGEIQTTDFMPPGCEHTLCSFQGLFMLDRTGTLKSLSKRKPRTDNTNAAGRVRTLTAKQWRWSPVRTLTIGGMLFQDAWNLDVARLKRCIIHIISPEKGLVPLCAKYLTAQDGKRLYPGIA